MFVALFIMVESPRTEQTSALSGDLAFLGIAEILFFEHFGYIRFFAKSATEIKGTNPLQ